MQIKSTKHSDIPPTPARMAISKRQLRTRPDKDKEREPWGPVGVVNWCKHHGKQHGVSSTS